MHVWLPLLLLPVVACKKADAPPAVVETADSAAAATGACAEMGLTTRPWQDVDEESIGRRNLAADFTVKTLDGPWTLSENWSGCDVYVFVPEADGSSGAFPTGLWDRDLDELLQRSPDNVHWFFFSEGFDPKASVEQLKDDMDDALRTLGKKKRDHLRDRLHYITKDPYEWNDWPGRHWELIGYGFLVDRLQTIRDIGSLADQDRYDGNVGWFAPNVSQATNEVVYANFLAERQDWLDGIGEDVTIVRAWDGDLLSGGPTVDVDLPAGSELAGYDVLELDLTLNCDGDREFGTCGAWDYLVYLHECEVPVEDNPFREQACQPHIPGVEEVLEVMGDCTIDGVPQGIPCMEDGDCGAVPTPDTGPPDTATETGTLHTGTSDTHDTGAGTGVALCEGYVAPVEGVIEVPGDTLPCTCTGVDGAPVETSYSCNGEGTGYNDCACGCPAEVGRWITTYHREGRWIHDASAMLPWLQEGGTQRFRFSTSQAYELTLDFRFRSTGGSGAVERIDLFTGGGFGEAYNDKYETLEIDIPADATRVDLAAVISGHGFGTDEANCAEFCNHTHHFWINGDEYVRDHPEANNDQGCMDQVAIGTVPNQFGTWFYGRGGWCPGMEVAPWVVDVSKSVTPGQTATIRYEGRLDGEPYVPVPANNGGFGARIDMVSWLGFHR